MAGLAGATLDTIWFVLIAVLFIGYFFLEGFDYGVGILALFLGHTDKERRAVLATIGPVWDANEVWLITAGGAMFAAFPRWYATLFSGFYFALALLLLALILRGVALEFRSKMAGTRWRGTWDGIIFGSSLVPPVIWGMAMANMLTGVPIDAQMNFVGSFFTLITPYTVLGGLGAAALFTLHGALYVALKTSDDLRERANRYAMVIGAVATALYFAFVILTYFYTSFPRHMGIDPGAIPVLAAVAMLAVRELLVRRRYGLAFAVNGLVIVLSSITVFMALSPRLMLSTLNPAWSLTITNAASNPYSLRVMTILALAALPLVLAYQAWTYWVFRRRISLQDTFHY